VQHRLHLTRVGAVQPEIREQHIMLSACPSAPALGNDWALPIAGVPLRLRRTVCHPALKVALLR
jgi:hypothetical protein